MSKIHRPAPSVTLRPHTTYDHRRMITKILQAVFCEKNECEKMHVDLNHLSSLDQLKCHNQVETHDIADL